MLKAGFVLWLTGLALLVVGFWNGVIHVLVALIFILLGLLLIGEKRVFLFSPLSTTVIIILWGFGVKGLYLAYVPRFSEVDLAKSLALVLVYILTFIIGYKSAAGSTISRKLPVFVQNSKRVPYFVCTVSVIAGVLLYTVLLRRWGFNSPIEALSNPLKVRLLMDNSGNMYFKTFILAAIQAPLWYTTVVLSTGNVSLGSITIFSFLLGVNLLVALGLGGRGLVLLSILGSVIIYSSVKGRVPYALIVTFGLLGLVFSGLYGVYRDAAFYGQTTQVGFDIKRSLELILIRYDGLNNLTRIVSDPPEHLWLGKSFLDFLFQPIPRVLFPGKPYPFGSAMTAAYLPSQFELRIIHDFTGVGELFVNGHLPGVLGGGLVFGVVIRSFNEYFWRNRKSIGFLVWYPFVYMTPMSWVMGGHISAAANGTLILNTALIIVFWYSVGGSWLIPKKESYSVGIRDEVAEG